jgi:hypothetical protein
MTDPFDGDVEVAELHAAQVREWSKWEARDVITIGAARAYNAGDAVPTANVEAHGYAAAGQVRLRAAWVVDNPDDPDVKTFLSWAKDHKDHPDVAAWETYRDERAAVEEAAADDNPFAPKPDAAARTVRKATVTTDKAPSPTS